MAVFLEEGEEGRRVLTSEVGSWRYMAPEVACCSDGMERQYDERVDIYSYAMVLYELVTEHVPFFQAPQRAVLKIGLLLLSGQRPDLSYVPEETPPVLRDVMVQSWAGDPAQRPAFITAVSTCARCTLYSLLRLQRAAPTCRRRLQRAAPTCRRLLIVVAAFPVTPGTPAVARPPEVVLCSQRSRVVTRAWQRFFM